MTIATDQLDRLAVDTIRTLSIDGVQQANSGHPGAPMGMAPMTYALWTRHLRHAPTNPAWPNRDRFVLSAGHASMLLYSMLHLTGYAVSLEDVESFRQWGSITPGHPEYGLTPGVEATTGPLGQGLTNAVGMAIAERRLAAEFNRDGHELIDHRTYVICSDGDLQEGVASEASSLAGHLKLGKLIALYDDNRIQLDGPTAWAFTEDVLGRYAAYGWHAQQVEDGTDLAAIDAAIRAAEADDRPSIIAVRTVIGYGSPNKAGTQKAHGAPLGPDEVRLTKEAYGWDPDKTFYIPDEARDLFRRAVDEGKERVGDWESQLAAYAEAFPAEAAELKRRVAGRLPDGWDVGLPTWDDGTEVATRNASQDAIQVLAAALPELFGGSADLSESNLTDVKADGHDHFQPDHAGRNLRFGVREHAMGGIVNGIAYHGGFLPYAATFLTFSDYMRGAVRLAALSGVHVTYVWTHDSVGLGEDGPTHQPVEHYAALRAIPNLWFVRPGDGNEAAAAWALAVERPAIAGASGGPVALAFTRQKLPTLAGTRERAREGVRRGGYILREAGGGEPQLILIGTGSELQLCFTAADALEADGIPTRVVSLPCWERFDAQDQAYRDRVLPPGVRKRVSVEAGVSFGWERWVGDEGAIIGIDHFGASAPAGTIFKEFGFTTDRVADVGRRVVREGLHGRLKTLSMPHGDHPTLEHGDPGVDRTPGSDPGHD
jgi:transketolase